MWNRKKSEFPMIRARQFKIIRLPHSIWAIWKDNTTNLIKTTQITQHGKEDYGIKLTIIYQIYCEISREFQRGKADTDDKQRHL